MTISDKVLDFLTKVHYTGDLPPGIEIMNPYRTSTVIWDTCQRFYNKYYNDTTTRKLILGINPGRLGAGSTGIPFTDTKRLNDKCEIPFDTFVTHEPSSVFMYEMMEAFGGIRKFYDTFYINAVFPLSFVKKEGSRILNFNYYDSKALLHEVEDFIIDNIQKQIIICGNTEVCYCIGSGKNFSYLTQWNNRYCFFKEIIPLEHPRFIMQYKSKEKSNYIKDYLDKLSLY